jgi:hypothetical protein
VTEHTVLKVKFDGRPIGYLAEPDVEVLSFARLEEENVVAVVQLGQLVQLGKARFRVELGIFSAVREHRSNIIKQMAVAVTKPYIRIAANY